MGGPSLQEKLSCLRVEYLLLRNVALRIHRQGCLLSEQACMEGVLGQECLAKLRVAEGTVVVLVKAGHEQCDFVVCDLETKVFETVDEVLDGGGACP